MTPPPDLVDEFPPVSTEEWEDQIRRDLKGADYGETLLWHTRDGMTIRPYYRSEDLERIAHVDGHETAALGGGWTLQQNIVATDGAADEVRAAVEGGAECIGMEFRDGAVDDDVVSALLAAIPLPEVGVQLDGGMQTPALYRMLLHEIERRPAGAASLTGTLAFDPLADFARTGALSYSTLDEAASLISEPIAPAFRLLRAGVETFHNAGATPVHSTALALASISEYLASLIERGADGHDVLRRLYVSVPVSTSFLLEIARLRALRLLIPQIVNAYLPDEEAYQLPIHAETSFRTMTLYDPHSNLLRATTAGAAAVIGGCDVLVVHPFDAVSGHGTSFSHRLARNIQHLMRHEGNFGKVSDPAGGSYYVEVLTDAVARRAWSQLKEIEARGGLLEALRDGYVQAQIRETRNDLLSDVARRRRVLVGTNRYPNPLETLGDAPAAATAPRNDTADLDVEPLEPFREGEAFEQIRIAAERLGFTPSILILPVGSVAVRNARANFAANFLASGGFVADTPLGYETLEDALGAAEEDPDLLVLAADDDLYSPEVLSSVPAAFSSPLLGIVVSDDVPREVDIVLNSRDDAVATLQVLLERLRRLHPKKRRA